MDDVPVKVGDVLAGKFKVEKILGAGGMGVVVAAKHLHLEKRVALKFMFNAVSANKEYVGRFLREARAAAQLRNQHIMQVLDVGTMDGGSPYMVLEFLEGSDLQEVVEGGQRHGIGMPSRTEAVDYIMQACVGMAEAHSQKIIHRDLKPSNLFRTTGPDGRALVKVLDFGIAKAAIDSIATSTEAIMGSPSYMSPEQWNGARDVDERGDIWALGAVLYFLLSGKQPFDGQSLPALYVQVAENEPAALSPHLNIPDGLKRVIHQCLHKKPDGRPQSVAQLASLLAPFGSRDAAIYCDAASALLSTTSSQDEALAHGSSGTLAGGPGAISSHVTRPAVVYQAPETEAHAHTWPAKQNTTMGASVGSYAYDEVHSSPKSKATRLFLATACLAIAGGLVAIMVLNSGTGTNPKQSQQASAPKQDGARKVAPASPLPVEQATAAIPTALNLSIASIPKNADIYLEGQGESLGKTPFLGALPTSSLPATLSIRKRGYTDLVLEVRSVSDATQSHTLQKLPTKAETKKSERQLDKSMSLAETPKAEQSTAKKKPAAKSKPAKKRQAPTEPEPSKGTKQVFDDDHTLNPFGE